MKSLNVVLTVSLATLVSGCLVDVPEPDDATFACTDNTECASGYRCYLYSSGDGVCVSEDGCSSDADCGAGKYCVPGEGVCAPERGCTENDDCPADRPFCSPDQVCIDPCAGVDCPAQAADTFCIVDLAAGEGYQCLPCEANPEACGPGRECVRSNADPGFRCAAACPTAGEPCNDGSVDGRCAEVEGVVPGGSSSSLAVCAVCDPTCSGATPDCLRSYPDASAPNLESAVDCQPTGGPCTTHSACGTSNYCAVQSGGGSNICVRECASVDSGCADINGETGWCVDAEIVGGSSALVCGSCPACGAAYDGCGAWPGQTTIDTLVGCVCVNDTACGDENTAAFRCVEGTCTDACDPNNPPWDYCPDPHVCQPNNVCGLCGNGRVDSGTNELCDDGDPYGGYCEPSCGGPECDWGLRFSAQADVAQVQFPPTTAHDMTDAGTGFAIDLWARVGAVPVELVSRSAADGTAPYYRLAVNGNWGIEFYVADTSVVARVIGSGNVTSGVLHHITAVRQTDGRVRVEIDGNAVGPSTTSNTTRIAPSVGLRFGHFPNGAFPADLEMDSVRLFNAELTATELSSVRRCEHYDGTHLVGEWLFDMAVSADTIVDTSPTGITNAVLTGNVDFANVPWQQ